MFSVDLETGDVSMHVGDTGSYIVRATRTSGEPFDADDRMLYTVKDINNKIVMQRVYSLVNDGLENGEVRIEYHNADTDSFPAGQYKTEMRYIISPLYDSAGNIVDGSVVRTPHNGQATLTLSEVYGEV